MSGGEGNGKPPYTPPAFVRQLDERVTEIVRKHGQLKSLVGANQLALLHQMGDIANSFEGMEKRMATLERTVSAGNKLLLQIFNRMKIEEED